jgi:hypothetical protein
LVVQKIRKTLMKLKFYEFVFVENRINRRAKIDILESNLEQYSGQFLVLGITVWQEPPFSGIILFKSDKSNTPDRIKG